MQRVVVVEAAVIKAAMIEIRMVEVAVVKVAAIHNRSAVGEIWVVVVEHPVVAPVPPPVIPAPTKTAKEAASKSSAEVEVRTVKKNSWHRVPTWICNDGITVHKPWVILGHVHHIWIGWFDDDRVALIRYFFLFVAV